MFRACFGTPAQIWSRDPHDKRELTTEFMFFALLRKGINSELPCWPEVVVVFDGQGGSAQRKEADAGYKANRPAAVWTMSLSGRRVAATPTARQGGQRDEALGRLPLHHRKGAAVALLARSGR